MKDPIIEEGRSSRLMAWATLLRWGVALLFDHVIGPKRMMPGVWGQSPQQPEKYAKTG
jgi:hypothetical protein